MLPLSVFSTIANSSRPNVDSFMTVWRVIVFKGEMSNGLLAAFTRGEADAMQAEDRITVATESPMIRRAVRCLALIK